MYLSSLILGCRLTHMWVMPVTISQVSVIRSDLPPYILEWFRPISQAVCSTLASMFKSPPRSLE